jgi:multidrug efflux pump subunit AcrA (membrane-fusion protein)
MNHRTRGALQLAMLTTLAVSLIAWGDDDDAAPRPGAATPTLNAEQQRAVGLRTVHPLPSKAPESTEALGTVLDRTVLLADDSEAAVAVAQAHAAAAELARLQELYQAGAGASRKMLETAQAEDAKARAESRLAAARFAQHWGPISAQVPEARRQLLDAVVAGRTALVRADLPGRHSVGSLPAGAVLDVDGIRIPGRVLGALDRPSDLQSAGLLIEVRNPPAGLSPGAMIPVALLSAEREGLLVPNEALLYGEGGAYVYKQLAPKTAHEKVQYVPVKVTPLVPFGDGWLVKGVDDDDDIVVRGAGVLWSLEGMGAHPVDDDDD